jgi:hypothetical protein
MSWNEQVLADFRRIIRFTLCFRWNAFFHASFFLVFGVFANNSRTAGLQNVQLVFIIIRSLSPVYIEKQRSVRWRENLSSSRTFLTHEQVCALPVCHKTNQCGPFWRYSIVSSLDDGEGILRCVIIRIMTHPKIPSHPFPKIILKTEVVWRDPPRLRGSTRHTGPSLLKRWLKPPPIQPFLTAVFPLIFPPLAGKPVYATNLSLERLC